MSPTSTEHSVPARTGGSSRTRSRGSAGVAAAEPSVEGAGQLVGSDGEPVGGQGPPTTAGNWIGDKQLNPYALSRGRAPRAPGEVVANEGAAASGKLEIGDVTTLRTPDPLRVKIVGLVTFGGESGMGQATFTGLTRADAERHLMPEPGTATSIRVRAEDGTSQRQLAERLEAALPEGIEAVTGQEAAEENSGNVSGQFLTLFTSLLLVFSGIALLVAVFSIHDTFAIVVAQRTRENALLRALGFPFPEGPLVISALSLLLPLGVGIAVCLTSALLPAVRAGRTAPLAALRETAVEHARVLRVRTAAGAAVAVRTLGAPVARLRGTTGALAQRNALRSPKRTAATAGALMIGVAVVTLFTVFASALKATTDETVSRNFAGDLAVSTPGFGAGGSGLSPELAPAVQRLPEVDIALGLGQGVARVDGRGQELTVTDPATWARSTARSPVWAPVASPSHGARPPTTAGGPAPARRSPSATAPSSASPSAPSTSRAN